jgi:hypothetical protein
MSKQQIASLRTLYEQLRELSQKAGIPDSDPRCSTPHTYTGLQEEIDNLNLGITMLAHQVEAAESDLRETQSRLRETQISLGQERLSQYRQNRPNQR